MAVVGLIHCVNYLTNRWLVNKIISNCVFNCVPFLFYEVKRSIGRLTHSPFSALESCYPWVKRPVMDAAGKCLPGLAKVLNCNSRSSSY